MKVTVDRGNCQGHGRCAVVAPTLFSLDEDGFVLAEAVEVDDAEGALARRAVRACPEEIISIDQDAATDAPARSPAA